MTTLGKLIGFAPIGDAERSRAFYGDVLGLTFVADDGFALVFRSGENMVRLARMQDFVPAQFTIMGWETGNLEAEVRSLTAKGAVFLRFAHFDQDSLGIWTAPSGDKVAWFTDPDGNVLSLSQHA